MDVITIKDLGVLCRIGVPEMERAKPQRLLISAEMYGDFTKACATDDIGVTIDYYQVARRITELCGSGSYRLIERLAHEIAQAISSEFSVTRVAIEVKKFVLPEARYISFKLHRP